MIKKFLSVLLAVMMVVSVLTVGVVTTSAAQSDGFTPAADMFYFDVDGTGWTMGAKDKIAFYFSGGDFDTEENTFKPLAWGSKKLGGTLVQGESTIYGFKPSAISGFKLTPGKQYKIIFAHMVGSNWNEQTCSLFFTDECLGHVAYSDGTEMENDVDSTKKSKTVYWRGIDPEKNGPVLCITSIGNVVGSCVEQGKTKYSLFVEFLSETKEDFQNKTCYQNAHKYKCEIDPSSAGYKTEQKLIDDIGEGLGLTKDEVQQAFNEQVVKDYLAESGLGCDWSYDASPLPGGSSSHTHTPGEPVIENDTPSTCKVAGTYDEVIYCTECGEEISRETKNHELAAHTSGEPVIENDTPSTCKVAGTYDEVVYCTVCGDEISRETKNHELAAHTPGNPVAIEEGAVPAGCEQAGSHVEVTYCSVCGDELSRQTVVDPATGHESPLTYVPEVPATASVDGVAAHYTCTKCGKLYSDEAGQIEVQAEDLVIKAEHVRGDANGDGTFDQIDVTVLQRWLVELEVESFDEVAADADLDGEIDIIDVSLMQRVLANMTTFEKWDAKHIATA